MKVKISSARSVKGNNQYTNELIKWADLRERFRKPKRTYETIEEYQNKLTKQEQTNVKDAAGAFVGGWLEVDEEKQGVDRNLENVISRSFLNFDFDEVDNAEQIEQLTENLYNANTEFILYSTHSHTPNKPRVRVLLPLDREVNKKEFEAISRLIVASSGLWAEEKGLHLANPIAQLAKIMEELGEVAQAYTRNQREELKVELGDLLVTVIIFAQQNNINLEEALRKAYNKINGRNGKMVDGLFIKEEDLND